MQQPPPDIHARSHECRALAVGVMASLWLMSCAKPSTGPDCVNVGMGWHTCSDDMMTSSATTPEAGGDASGGSGGSGVLTGSAPAHGAGRGGSSANADAGSAGGGTSGEGGGSASGIGGTHAGIGAAAHGGDASSSGAGEPAGGRGGRGDDGAVSAGRDGSASAGRGGSASAGRDGNAANGGRLASSTDDAGHGDLPSTCCHSLGICVDGGKLSAVQRGLLVRDTCSDAMLCTPTGLLDEQSFAPRNCHSVLQGEGRCLPQCMAILDTQGQHFPQDICDANELCAPCFDPLTGNATGFCSLGADKGPSNLPQVFGSCCGTGTSSPALCVPASYVPKGGVMVHADCSGNLFCVPRAQVMDPSTKLASCSGEIRGAGVCLPQCIADSIEPIIATIQADCSANEICYPCRLTDGTSTNVCAAP